MVPAKRQVSVVPGGGLAAGGRRIAADVVFPVLHGTFGEDGTVQGLLEVAGLPYVGAGVLASSLAMDKDKTKEVWRQAGLPVVESLTLRDASPASVEAARAAFPLPVFVKPSAAGSSVGIRKVSAPDELGPSLAEALRYDTKALVEPAVDAREIECSVLATRSPRPSAGESFRGTSSILRGQVPGSPGAELHLPAELPVAHARRSDAPGRAAFRAVECSGLAGWTSSWRRAAGGSGSTRSIPCRASPTSCPKMCEVGGLAYPRLLDRLLELALERHRRRAGLLFSRE
jgi:D-alanine-D-alanine ligase